MFLLSQESMVAKQRGEWRPEMTDNSRLKKQCSAFKVYLALVICALLLSSCKQPTAPGTRARRKSADEKKAELIARINRKFENPDAHYELGRLYHAEGNWDEAEHEYSIALGFDPVHRKAQAAIVKVLLDSGDKAGSESAANKYIGQASDSAVGSLRLAKAFLREMLDEYAATCFRQAIDLGSESAMINREVGYYYLAKGDKDQARKYLSDSFRINPKQEELATDLGRLGVETRIPEKDKNKPDKGTKK